MTGPDPANRALEGLLTKIGTGEIEIVDLTHVLDEHTPPIRLPAPKASPPRFTLRELSRYDERGEHEYWNAFETGEHVGTHFDAPIHWHTGKDLEDVSQIPPVRLIGLAAVLDVSEACERDADHLVTLEDVERWQRTYGPLPDRGWLLLRTGWDRRYGDEAAFLGLDDEGRPHWPGLTVECARWLAEETSLIGLGIDCIGTDAAISHGFEPPHPAHHYLHGAGKYGMSLLANLHRLPPTGAIVLAAPLRIGGGSGSPMRALGFVPHAAGSSGALDEHSGR
jgi:kynurenine formamidase